MLISSHKRLSRFIKPGLPCSEPTERSHTYNFKIIIEIRGVLIWRLKNNSKKKLTKCLCNCKTNNSNQSNQNYKKSFHSVYFQLAVPKFESILIKFMSEPVYIHTYYLCLTYYVWYLKLQILVTYLQFSGKWL